MKQYWDSSALIAVLHQKSLRTSVSTSADFTRLHTLAELFCTLTKGVNFRYPPDDAAKMIDALAQDLSFVDLTRADILSALSDAKKLGVRGAQIHDLLHFRAAQKCGAQELFTLDSAGFKGLAGNLTISSP
jgi:predicted nucleic acid-binding protein